MIDSTDSDHKLQVLARAIHNCAKRVRLDSYVIGGLLMEAEAELGVEGLRVWLQETFGNEQAEQLEILLKQVREASATAARGLN